MRNNGFTFIEVMLVIGIFVVVASITVPVYGNWQNTARLSAVEQEVKHLIRLARERSLARKNNASHGVYFEENVGIADSIIIFQGSSYASRNTDYDEAINLVDTWELQSSIVDDELIFNKGLGMPTATGTVSITNDNNQSVQINNNEFGIITQ